ncbi:hypothetical protein TL16_g08281 [Triparma laevis f. inornata]|uniref:Uncharacterized protein n=1 Tax=Triparma laevis f. inornata TaxID=1714386 RepID=A0A9W7B3H0_9STRA|nr:hypothetical protein TL16_g08281 [Triparma laevis f. inornata]
MLQFAGWEIFDNMMLFCFVSIVGFCLIETWRWVTVMKSLNDCGNESQLMKHEAAAERRMKFEPFPYVILLTLTYASNCPHQFMYSKLKSFAIATIFVFFFFLFMHTPALEERFALPVSKVAEDIAIRIALFLRLVGTTEEDGGWMVDGTLAAGIKCAIAFQLWITCAGFAHSLSQFARVSSFILKKKKQASLVPLKVVIGIVAFIPILVLLTYVFGEKLEGLSGMQTHNFGAIHLRIMLGSTWAFLYFAMVPKHLQFCLQQAVQDCTKDLRNHTVDPEKVRTHFYQRSTLLVYSACQLMCFGTYLVILVLLASSKSALGSLGHARPFVLGSFKNGPFEAPVVSRSTVYDFSQKLFVGKKGVARRWRNDMWDDEDMKKIVDEEGGWAKVIAYHDVDFEETNLINSKDKAKAKKLKEKVRKVRKVLFSMTYHTFISPPNWIVLADCFAGIMCVLWVIVYCNGVFGYLKNAALNSKNEVDMDFDFEISEMGEGVMVGRRGR